MEPILIFGNGGHAKVVTDALERQGLYKVHSIIENEKDEELLKNLGIMKGIIAIGDNWKRSKIAENILKTLPNFEFVTVIHPNAVLGKDVSIGRGTVVMAGAVINPGTSIDEHCIINTSASIDHDCKLCDYSSVAPGATLGGAVTVGDFTAVGLGASVIHGITIGDHSIIGAGSTVVKDIDKNVVAFGTPCKIIRKREAGEGYL